MFPSVLFIFYFTSCIYARIIEIPLPYDIKQCFDEAKKQTNLTQIIGEVVFSRCVHRVLWTDRHGTQNLKLGDDARKWIQGLVDMNKLYGVHGGDGVSVTENGLDVNVKQTGYDAHVAKSRRREKRQALRRQPRVRKEYRMLTDRERRLFHRAINMLKADRSVLPNKYDALGRLHFMSIGRSHFGPNFYGWHRLLLVVLENALREKIPSVTIPYWDSTLDERLLDPRSSILWTADFVGQANGYVIDGPFAGWNTPAGPLIRKFGTAGTMLNWTYIHNAFRKNHLEDITAPSASPDNNLEEHHNQVHLWVGGHMAPPALAAFDPIFYMLHSFTDLLWEIFRGLQKRRGVDPTTDYPRNDTIIPSGHRYNDPSGFGTLYNRHALSDVYTTNIYKYERPPTCTHRNPNCGSQYINCDTSGVRARCKSASIFDIRRLFTSSGLPMEGSSGRRELRSTRKRDRNGAKFNNLLQHAADVKCEASNVNDQYVNNFNINGVAAKHLWAYIPVEVVYKNKANAEPNNSLKVYDQCMKVKNSELPVRAFVESNGINYNGNFKQISHFQKEVQTSSSIVYIGVKKPTDHTGSNVLVSAYDACGRMCQPYCLNKNGSGLQKCSGAIKILREFPLMYGNDVRSVSNFLWQDESNGLPNLSRNQIFISIVCDINASFWPW